MRPVLLRGVVERIVGLFLHLLDLLQHGAVRGKNSDSSSRPDSARVCVDLGKVFVHSHIHSGGIG